MRLSLRTLLAFEDNIFDAEQHRQLERIIPKHDAAAMTLYRIRGVVRNPHLGVPGIVDQREELDPNFVAEYLDHQMNQDLQERFEAHCLTSDKYLAEVASVHQILSGVLGEPARTSRECRLRCYDLFRASPEFQHFGGLFTAQAAPDSFSSAPLKQQPQPMEEPAWDPLESLRAFEREAPPSSRPVTVLPEPEVDPCEFRSAPLPPSRPEVVRVDRPEVVSAPSFWTKFCGWFGTSESKENAKPKQSTEHHPEGKRKGFWCWMLLLLLLLGLLGMSPVRQKLETLVAQHVSKETQTDVREKSETRISPPKRLPAKKTRSTPKNDPPGNAAPSNDSPPAWVISSPEIKRQPQPTKLPPAVATTPLKPLPAAPQTESIVAATAIVSTQAPPKTETVSASEQVTVSDIQAKTADPFLLAASTPSETTEIPAVEPVVKPIPATDPFSPVLTQAPVEKLPVPEDDPFLATVSPLPDVSWAPSESLPKTDEISVADPKSANPLRATSPSKPFEVVEEPATLTFITVSDDKNFDTEKEIFAEPVPSPDPFPVLAEARHDESDDKPVPENSAGNPVSESSPVAFRAIESKPRRTTFREETEIPIAETAPIDSLPVVEDIAEVIVEESVRPAPLQLRQPLQGTSWEEPLRETPSAEVAVNERPNTSPMPTIIPAGAPAPTGPASPPPPATEPMRLSDGSIGLVPANQEPCVLFVAGSANEQWRKESFPLKLRAGQYLLSMAPFRVVLELENVGFLEMIGDSKVCLLPPDVNGVPGIYVDYGRLILRPHFRSGEAGRFKSLRISTESAEGIVSMSAAGNLVFIDTFAEIVPSAQDDPPAEAPADRKSARINPILGFLAAPDAQILWSSPTRNEPMVADRHTSIILESGQSEFGVIRHLPSWLQRHPLSAYGHEMAATSDRIFRENGGYSEAALHAMIQDSNNQVRAFGFRLWGDLGRFDVPLKILAQTDKEDDPIRQSLAPYFREVMKRDEETVQRLSDAVEMVRR